MKNTTRTLSLVASVSAAAVLAACGGGGGGSAPGTLSVAMTDAPSCGYDAVNVTVKAVRVHKSASAGENDAGWTDITLNPARKINLLNLTNGALEELGQTPLAAGHYTQMRLVLEPNTGASLANSIILTTSPANANEIALKTPSAAQSGIKLNHPFDVASGQRVDLVLDFDACKSIVKMGKSGGYGLKPVVNVIPTVLNGINGFIDPALLGSHVQVSAQQDGTVVRSTVPNANGEFFLARLPTGDYDVVITADDSATTVIGTVPVADATSVVTVNTNTAPIGLPAAATGAISGLVTLSPASDAVAYVAAQQSFAAGPTVTVQYQGADLETGEYTLSNLPTTAPLFAQYSATQPLAFAVQDNTVPGTGKYQVEASATGYATQFTPSVDISTTNQSGVNFALIP
ncbi:MAG: DUF4382 domain-containing protein [Oxalobacteraceae bacterium]|nr:DUF4382 domain-containing protein [Oxalobacteraceae bacterium]